MPWHTQSERTSWPMMPARQIDCTIAASSQIVYTLAVQKKVSPDSFWSA